MPAPSHIEKALDASHKRLSKSAFWVGWMLDKRRFSRSYTERALDEARRAVAILESLDPKRTNPNEE